MRKCKLATIVIAATITLCSSSLQAQQETVEPSDSTAAITFNQLIKSDSFNQGLVTDPMQLISGQAPGVSLIKVGSDPNVFSAPQIRGTTSLLNSGIPLYIIDGVVGAEISMVLPDEIESFEILKDAVSTARYGSRGVNGVIVITTKSQHSDKKLAIEFNTNVAFNTPAKRMDLLSAADIRKFAAENNYTLHDAGASTDWQDEIFRNTITQTYDLALHGQVKQTGYRVSIFRQDNQGIVLGSSRQNTGINLHLTQKALNDKLNLTLTASFSNPKSESLPSYTKGSQGTSFAFAGTASSIFYQAFTRSPLHPVYEADGTTLAQENISSYYNPLALIRYTENTNDSKNLNLNLGANYQIAKGLNFDLTLGYNYLKNKDILDQTNESMLTNAQEVSSEATVQNKHFNVEAALSYKKSLGENHHFKIGAICAQNILQDESQSNYTTIYTDSTETSYDYIRTNENYLSLISQFDYNFKERYCLSATMNQEYYTLTSVRKTIYTPVNAWGYPDKPYDGTVKQANIYPALTLAWKLHNETFMKPLKFISNFTIKGGYGFTGNNDQFKELYLYPGDIDINTLETERTSVLSLGLNVGLFKNRINGSLTYYNRITDNGIAKFSLATPPSKTGFCYANGDHFSNKGLEITISAIPISSNNFQWHTSGTYFGNKNELVSRKSNSNTIHTGLIGDRNYNWAQILKEGSPYPVFYMPEFAEMGADGHPLFYTASGGRTQTPNSAQRRVMGQITPKYELGWMNNFQIFKVFDASFAMRYISGHSIYNATRADLANPDRITVLNATQEAVDNYNNGYVVEPLSSQYLEDASFLRLENITIGYTMKSTSAKWNGSVRFYLSGTNLLTFTKYKGLDPSPSATGIDSYNVYPLAKSFVAGIKLIL